MHQLDFNKEIFNKGSSEKTDVHNEENIFSVILSFDTDFPELIRCVK